MTSAMRGTSVKKIATIITIAFALLLSGCSSMNTAAKVGSKSITLKDFQGQIDSIIAERKAVDTSQMQLETGEDLARSHLSYMVANLIIQSIGEDQKIAITKADLDAYKSEIFANIGGEANLASVLVNAAIPQKALEDVLRRDLIIRKITEAEKAKGSDDATISETVKKLVQDKASALKVTINPRYGKWDDTTLSVVAAEPAGDAVKTK
jgi:uncharacterized protein YejL (UPF0352 family)